jgi:predicted Fe-S protein YdhL (DUF1289 family)
MSAEGARPHVPPTSPCVRICVVDPERGLCRGCWRTFAEIASWRRMSDAEQRAVLDELPARRAAGQ